MGRKKYNFLAPNILVDEKILEVIKRKEKEEKEKIKNLAEIELAKALARLEEWRYFNKKERRVILTRFLELGVWDPELQKEILNNLLQEKIYCGRFWLP